MKAFRLALAQYGGSARDVFSGLGGFTLDGRWHSRGRHLDYAAQSLSLAVLERLVHYKRFDRLRPHVLCTLEVPDLSVTNLPSIPAGWDGVDLLTAAQALGNDWFDRRLSPVLRAPSAVTRGEFNILVNPGHPDWRWDWVSEPAHFAFDTRLTELVASARNPPRRDAPARRSVTGAT